MNVQLSYKQYLESLGKRSSFSSLQKILIFSLLIILVIGGTFSAFSFYRLAKETPQRAEKHYLEVVQNGFYSTRNSLSEIISTFQIAGAKVKTVDTLKDSAPDPSGYFVSLEDIDKTIAQVESTQKNLLEQKNLLSKLSAPDKFFGLGDNLFSYYSKSGTLLESLLKEQRFARELLIVSGTSFYLPTLGDERLWKDQKAETIIGFYDGKKHEATVVLADLAHIAVPEDFKNYYDAQISYLELLINTSDEIIKILSQDDKTDQDDIPQVEKAYQALQVAKNKNGELSEKLLGEKIRVFDKKRNLEKFAEVSLEQNAIVEGFSGFNQNSTVEKTFGISTLFERLLKAVF